MPTRSHLREKQIEALFSGAGTAGERLAAEAALERVRAKLAELERQDPAVELQFSMPDQLSRHLFIALCRRYGLQPYRYRRQGGRRSWFVRLVVSSMKCCGASSRLDVDLQAYLMEVTLKIIREEVYADASDAQDMPEALPAA